MLRLVYSLSPPAVNPMPLLTVVSRPSVNRVFAWNGLLILLLTSIAGVQAGSCMNNISPSNPDSAYVDHANGTVTDTRTGLMWKQCLEGLSGPGCLTGTARTYTWAEALGTAEASNFADYDDWRLPNIRELRSLVEECRVNPSINDTVFPYSRSAFLWSSSPDTRNSDGAWGVYFGTGASRFDFRSVANNVRVVRSPQ
jgi:hypothetical protein